MDDFKLEIYKDYLYDEPKELKKFLSSCKRMIRNSYEYSSWVSYIKFNMGIDRCVFTEESSNEVTVEIHHHPFSIENIIKVVFDKYMDDPNDDKISSVTVVEEVINLHKAFNVGFVPLVTTLHEKFHNGYLQIPMEYVKGNWRYLLTNYSIEEDIMKVVDKYLQVNIYNNPYKSWIKLNDNGVLEEAS
jgi:hypothetical protein